MSHIRHLYSSCLFLSERRHASNNGKTLRQETTTVLKQTCYVEKRLVHTNESVQSNFQLKQATGLHAQVYTVGQAQ